MCDQGSQGDKRMPLHMPLGGGSTKAQARIRCGSSFRSVGTKVTSQVHLISAFFIDRIKQCKKRRYKHQVEVRTIIKRIGEGDRCGGEIEWWWGCGTKEKEKKGLKNKRKKREV